MERWGTCNTKGRQKKLKDVAGVMEPTLVIAIVVPSTVRMEMGLIGV